MASNASKECAICNEEFNEGENCPRMLPCFDCLCSNCIERLIATDNKSCPFCRKTFSAKSAQDLRINTNLLDILKYVAELETGKTSPENERTLSYAVWKKDFRKEFSKKNIADCKKARAEINSAIKNNSELRDELQQTNKTIRNEILKRLEKIEKKNGKQIKDLEEDNKRLKIHLKAILEKEENIKDADVKLEAAVNFSLAAPTIDMSEDITDKLEKTLKDLKVFLSRDQIKRHNLWKDDIGKTKRKISVIHDILTPLSDEEDVVNPIPGMAAMAIVQDSTEDNILSVDALRSLSGPVRELVRNGKLLAVQRFHGRRRYARITITEEDQLFLHHLKEEEHLPTNVHLIKHNDVKSLVDISCRRIFLELGVEGRSLGSLLIRLFNNEILAKQFSIFCTGEMGPSYAHSNIFDVWNKGHDKWENVCMGDYESNNGIGGKAILEGVNWWREGQREIYKKSHLKGTVQGLGFFTGREAMASQFRIYTRDRPGCHLNGSFGMIESGLNILIEAISNYPNEISIDVMDCGIVLSRGHPMV